MWNKTEQATEEFDNHTCRQWQRLCIVDEPDFEEKLDTPLPDIVEYSRTTMDFVHAARFAEAGVYSGVITLRHLVTVGTEPVSQLMGVNFYGRYGLSTFTDALSHFWPTMRLPTMPSPEIAAVLYSSPSQVRTYPWVIDYVDGVSIGGDHTRNRAPGREMYWSLELLLGANPKHLQPVFETRNGRTAAILDYYREYEKLYQIERQSRNKA